MSLDELRRFLPPPPGLLQYSEGLVATHAAATRLVAPMAAPRRYSRDHATGATTKGGLSTLLLVGEAGSGRTALAAHLAWRGGGGGGDLGGGDLGGGGALGGHRFAFTHVVSPDELPAGEQARVQALEAVMRDAAQAETACVVRPRPTLLHNPACTPIVYAQRACNHTPLACNPMYPELQPYVSPLYLEVLDDLERLLGHVLLSGDANGNAASEAEGALQLSPAILEALLSHLRRPPAAGRQLMIIGVTAARFACMVYAWYMHGICMVYAHAHAHAAA